MKLLLIGIDGGDWDIFDKYEMPFLQSLRQKGMDIELTEDLHSRGWVEVISGEHASENNGFYYRPLLDGTTKFTYKYTFDELVKHSKNPTIWELPKKGSVGVMNVPTTYPSPKKVNGFFVSGAGGGLTKVAGIPDEMCSDEATQKVLKDSGYIIDLRLVPSGITDTALLFSKLEDMMVRRFRAFIELSVQKQCGFGFLVLRAPTVVTYAGRYEIEKGESAIWHEHLGSFFRTMDKEIERCFQELKPKNHIITSDHGCAPQEYLINYNIALSELGYLNYEKTLKSRITYLKGWLKTRIKDVLGRFHQPEVDQAINFRRTRVFGKSYFHGLYVNDEKRFGGPVVESEIDALVDECCSSFNASGHAEKYNLIATPHRRNFVYSAFSDSLPDIWIECPDNIYHLGKGRSFVQRNPSYRKLGAELPNGVSSMLTGAKGRRPVFTINKELVPLLDRNRKDLTAVYHLAKSLYANE